MCRHLLQIRKDSFGLGAVTRFRVGIAKIAGDERRRVHRARFFEVRDRICGLAGLEVDPSECPSSKVIVRIQFERFALQLLRFLVLSLPGER